ncbi:MAG: hypothetical protein DI536_11285 [Archangium gephyra]|uniref:DUF3828 domain-containing protein n=1 Tax=Archangium gephyra TaxID=48 RepID=A0A2W5TM78_9BACT|nr:MAG: hypothetical protein DI536_11285 [Archangium gephyra]
MFRRLLLSGFVFSSVAMAQGTEGPAAAPAAAAAVDADTPESKAAKELVQKYLTAVKAKKWADAKKFLHPKTLEAIAERKKRLGKEDHPMAPWFHEKVDYWMKDFKVGTASAAPLGTIIVETTEDNFQVEEKGLAEGERSAYLVGKQGGKWFVVDKKRGETFTKDSVKLGYKGWFDKIEKAPTEEAAE